MYTYAAKNRKKSNTEIYTTERPKEKKIQYIDMIVKRKYEQLFTHREAST